MYGVKTLKHQGRINVSSKSISPIWYDFLGNRDSALLAACCLVGLQKKHGVVVKNTGHRVACLTFYPDVITV